MLTKFFYPLNDDIKSIINTLNENPDEYFKTYTKGKI